MTLVAIIPARGGSKRIQRKNIKSFLGKPIIAYAIEAAKSSELFEEVMVSTDDDEIAEISIQYGAAVPFKRSVANSNDFATTSDVVFEVLKQYESIGKTYEFGCCIYATAVFATKDSLISGYELLKGGSYKSVFPVLRFSYPIQRALKMAGNRIKLANPEHLNSRSQDLETFYHDSGQFYLFNVAAFLKDKKLFTDNSAGIVISEMHAQDIDNDSDWNLAEYKYQYQQRSNNK